MPVAPRSLFHRLAVKLIDEGNDACSRVIFADCPPSDNPDDNRMDFTLKVLEEGTNRCKGYVGFRIAISRQDAVNSLSSVKIYNRGFIELTRLKYNGYLDDDDVIFQWYWDMITDYVNERLV